jgi:hypothetical protein
METVATLKEPPSMLPRDALVERLVQLRDSAVVHSKFYRQDEAFAFSAAVGRRHGFETALWKPGRFERSLPGAGYLQLPVFGYDSDVNRPGSKSYLVASYERFYDTYRNTPPKMRFFYEILLADMPCHLYVDAEYLVSHNPLADAAWMDASFRELVVSRLVAEGIAPTVSDVRVLVLDASTPDKFSKHYLFKVQGKCFVNNFHCGAFMRRLCNYALESQGSPEKEPGLIERLSGRCMWIYAPHKTPEGPETIDKRLVADLGVYTINRNFRLAWSSKRKGAFRPLLPVGDDKELSYDRLLDFMIQRCTLLECANQVQVLEPDGSPARSTSDLRRFRVDADVLLGVSARKRRLDTSIFVVEPMALVRADRFGTQRTVGISDATEKEYDSAPVNKMQLSRLIGLLCAEIKAEWKDSSMGLMAKTVSSHYRSIQLSSSSRECRVAGREHTSNHVFFRVSLVTKRFYQRCFHDGPPCNLLGMRSAEQLASMLSPESIQRLEREREGYLVQDKEALELMASLAEKLSAAEQGMQRTREAEAFLDLGDRFARLFSAKHPSLADAFQQKPAAPASFDNMEISGGSK